MRRCLLLLSGVLAFVLLVAVVVLAQSPVRSMANSLTVTNDGPTIFGRSTTLTATAGIGFSYAWSLGDGVSAAGPVVTHTYQAVGVYTAVVTATGSVQTFYGSTTVFVDVPVATMLLNEGFEGDFPPPGWLNAVETPASTPWDINTSRVHGGAQSVFHDDIRIGEYGRQDAWLVTPRVTPTLGSELVFWQNENYAPHYLKHSIWVSVECQDPKECNFVQLVEVGPGSEDAWEVFRADLGSYAGQPAYLAFRYEGMFSDQEDRTDEWYVDDVQVTSALLASHDGPKAPGQAVTFVASATTGSNVNYVWAFGDGQTANGAVVAHAYTALGNYTAVVTASNSVGAVTRTLLVPVRAFIYLPLVLRGF
jgi:PKD repeat protein